MSYEKTTAASRRAAREKRTKYIHVSVNVGKMKDPATGMIVPSRTPRGQGGTARRNPDYKP